MGLEQLIANNAWAISLVSLIVIPIKGYALWTSAKRNEKWWFIALLVINTLAILELVYLLGIVKVQKNWKKSPTPTSTPKTPDAPKEETNTN